MAQDKATRDALRKARQRAYYLAHKADFKRRNREFWFRHRDKLAKSKRRSKTYVPPAERQPEQRV